MLPTSPAPGGAGTQASSVSVGIITVDFQDEVGVGQYANGDKYIYDSGSGITIAGPISSNDRDGMMLNIVPGKNVSQGFDSRVQNTTYSEELNIATQLPYTLQAGDSLVVCKSFADDATGDNPQLEEIAVIIVEDANNLPPVGSFRPNFYGPRENRVHRFTVDDLDWSIIGNYGNVSAFGQMDLATAIDKTRRPYMEYQNSWISRYSHAFNNQSPYGREISNDLSGAVVVLNSDYSIEEKTPLFIQCVQNGLDAAGAASAGQVWLEDGGHNLGRKTTIVLAAAALGDSSLIPPLYSMQDDTQIFSVDQNAVDITQSGFISEGGQWNPDSRDITDGKTTPYAQGDIGTPEWGVRHFSEPSRDNGHEDAKYRQVNGGCICQTVIAVNMFGGKSLWNNDVYFDYADRYANWIGLSNWTGDLWNAYRSEFN